MAPSLIFFIVSQPIYGILRNEVAKHCTPLEDEV